VVDPVGAPAAAPDGIVAAYENPRPEIQALVPTSARRILDLGCSSGMLGAALKRRQGSEVVGVELDEDYAHAAEARLDRVVQADLQELLRRDDLEAELGRFDCLIAGDVLEHLTDPWAVLGTAVTLIDPGDIAVVSLPNVRFWETFWVLGRHGRWPRRSVGLFDRTHLRFFTAADAIELVEGAGLRVERIERQYRLHGRHPSRWDRHVRIAGRTPLRPFFVYQHVIAARRR
jgi:methionine biosynthesis protein MetW